ncbi:condensation domain-containing protein, partial [Rhodococcus phenolicus]|uniref:condensation domain-containing protein n=1 Tax=Rhodococcus phenolicus TaxID=263849 RepID=UPI000AE1BEED
LGGDSIVALRVVTAARRAGFALTSRDVFEAPTPADLALRAVPADALVVAAESPHDALGVVVPTAMVTDLLAQEGAWVDGYAQARVVTLPADLTDAALGAALSELVATHAVLRARVVDDPTYGRTLTVPAEHETEIVLQHCDPDDPAPVQSAYRALDPASGTMVVFVLLVDGPAPRLLIVAHHLVVDAVSWNILLDDLRRLCEQPGSLERPVTSFRTWSRALEAAADLAADDADLWRKVVDPAGAVVLTGRALDPAVDTVAASAVHDITVAPEVFETLSSVVAPALRVGVDEILLAALAAALTAAAEEAGATALVVDVEGHGRESDSIAPELDLSRTVGWLTTLYPLRLDVAGVDLDAVVAGTATAGRLVKRIKEQIREIPDRGIGYGLLTRYRGDHATELTAGPAHPVLFNYLGRIDSAPAAGADGAWTLCPVENSDGVGTLGVSSDPTMPMTHPLEINAAATAVGITAQWRYAAAALRPGVVDRAAELWIELLEGIAVHGRSGSAGGLTPSDVLASVDFDELDELTGRFPSAIDVLPLTPLQQGLMFESTFDTTGHDAYVVQMALDITGDLDPVRLRAAADAVLAAHSQLGSAFTTTDGGRQVAVVATGLSVPWQEVDLSDSAPGDLDRRWTELAVRDRETRFDLDVPPLMRITLVHNGSGQHRMLLTHHHLLFDGWSLPLVIDALLRAYGTGITIGAAPAVAAPARRYRDYLTWLGDRDEAADLAAWTAALAGVSEPTLLASGRALAPGSCVDHTLTVDAEIASGLEKLRRATGVTLNTIVQVAWSLALGAVTGRDEVLFGTAVSGRAADLDGIDAMIGMTVNTIVVRVGLRPAETVAELLRRVQAEQAALQAHHHVGLADLHRITGLDELFDTLVVFENYPGDFTGATAGSGLDVQLRGIDDGTSFPLTLLVLPGEQLELIVKYHPELPAALSTDLVDRFVRVLAQCAVDVGVPVAGVSVLSPVEAAGSVVSDVTAVELLPLGPGVGGSSVLPVLFTEAVAAFGDAVAVSDDAGVSLSFAGVGERVFGCARLLASVGVRSESRVVVLLPRSVESVVASWAVVCAGGAFVPVDVGYPAERVEFMISDVDPVVVVTSSVVAERFSSVLSASGASVVLVDSAEWVSASADAGPVVSVLPGSAAYVIYTSGSTGRPKGIVVSHESIVNLVRWRQSEFPVGVGEVVLQKTSPSFDPAVPEVLWPVLVGARCELIREGGERDLEYLGRRIVDSGAVFVELVPTVMSAMVESGVSLAGSRLRYLSAGGEELTWSVVDRVSSLWSVPVWNTYGPAEAAVEVTSWRADQRSAGSSVPIGL